MKDQERYEHILELIEAEVQEAVTNSGGCEDPYAIRDLILETIAADLNTIVYKDNLDRYEQIVYLIKAEIDDRLESCKIGEDRDFLQWKYIETIMETIATDLDTVVYKQTWNMSL